MSQVSIRKRSLFAVTTAFFLGAGLVQCAAAATASTPASAASPRVLMVVSSHGQDEGKTRPGFELDEFALAYMVFRANGLDVEIASPKGGKAEPDKFNPKRDQIAAFQAQPGAATLFDNSLAIAEAKAERYQAVFVAGGKGAMFDIAQNEPLGRLMAQIYERGGVVSALCHGSAALTTARLSNGQLLAKGRRVTGFTNEEEAEFGKRWVKEFPYLVETKLREQGALWQEAGIMLPHTVVDGRLITGQNPFSTADVAEALVKALGRKPVARTVYAEEATVKLGAQHFAGDSQIAAQALKLDAKRYRVEMLAYLGYVHAKAASTDAKRREALALMLAAEPYTNSPRVGVSTAEIEVMLGERASAKARLNAVLSKHPAFTDAQTALAALK